MKPLDRNSIDMEKVPGRKVPSKFVSSPPSTIDDKKVFFAKRDLANGKKKNIQLAVMQTQLPRDELLYRQTDSLANIGLENTKDQREADLAKKREERMNRVKQHTQMRQSMMPTLRINP